MQGTDETGRFECGVEPVGFFQRGRIDRDQRVDRRPLLVIGRDPIEIGLYELPDRERPGLIGRMNVGDRRFEQLEGVG